MSQSILIFLEYFPVAFIKINCYIIYFKLFVSLSIEPAQPEILEISSAIDEDSKTSAMLIIKWRVS